MHCRVTVHNCTLTTSAVAERFDCVWLQNFVNDTGPAYSANLLARVYDTLKEQWLLL